MKKIISLVLVLAMILMVGAVYADGESTLPTAEISITNLEENDQVSLYKIIEWDTAASDWALTVTLPEAYDTVDELVAALNGNDAPNAMTALAAAVASQTVTPVTVGANGTYTSEQEVGSYLALIATSTANVYNPMVLSVNFTNPTTATGGEINASTAVTGSTSVAKKQPVTVTKEVNDNDKMKDVAVDDIIPFIVSTVTPNYGENYTDPVFTITDTLSTGLTLNASSIVVKNGTTTLEEGEDKAYTITTDKSGYTISFTETYLHSIKSNTAVTVEYTATVNEKAVMHQVERYTNEVGLVFSNSPSTTNNSLKAKTNHYTFSIDAYLSGESGGEGSKITRELVKVGVDGEGNVLTKFVTGKEENWNWSTGVQPLQGATFTLVGNDHTYNATSDGNGYLTFTGLDAGTYALTETGAPAGYKFDTTPVAVVITAEYYGEGVEGHAADELESYSITIGDTATSTYNVTNDGEYTVTAQEVVDGGITFPINNIKAVTLPSTGGIGTTIFYILGGLLVVGAAVILVARRKAQD